MNRDTLIAIGSEIPRSVSVPLAMGALRSQNSLHDARSWVEEAIRAHSQGRRPVLVGDISQPDHLLDSLLAAKKERPQIQFALLLHFSQALQTPLTDRLRSQFDEVFVAVDQLISVADAHAIRQSVRPRWVLIPRVGLDWNQILIDRLLPDRRGTATILCPPAESPWSDEGPFLSADELLIHLHAFQHEHPLIEVRPPPHEWFIPSQIAPWEKPSRDPQMALVLKKTEDPVVPNISIIVPFHWQMRSAAMSHLTTCLHSCLRVIDYVYAQSEALTVEYIVSVDRDHDAEPFDITALKKSIDPRIFRSLTILEAARTNDNIDWRAGFIRNLGAQNSRVGSGGLLVFVDSDVEIVDPAIVANEIIEGRNSLVFSRVRDENQSNGNKASSRNNLPFQVASSRLMIVRRSLFENLGGFAKAFRTYGCEDNFLVWQTTEILKKGLPVSFAAFPFATTKDLSSSVFKDDLIVKMERLKAAADLFFRMTFDPRVHRHFFISLGPGMGFRYFIKRIACEKKLRPSLGPVIFIMTLIETKNRVAYLRGLWDVIRWKIKRPLLLVSSEAWRMGQAKHIVKKHSWKIPNLFLKSYFLIRHAAAMALVIIHRISIKLAATRFGWNIFGWRVFVGLKKLWGESRRLLAAHILFPGLHIRNQIVWWSKVGGERVCGGIKFFAGWCHKLFVDFVWIPSLRVAQSPYHLTRLYGWRLTSGIAAPFRYTRDNFWKLKVIAKKLRGELWRIPVLWNRFLGRLWFIPVGFKRLGEKIRGAIRFLKEKTRGTP